MDRERGSSEGNKARFELLLEKAQDRHSKGAYEEALENVSQAIELAPEDPRAVKDPEIFVNALAERASVYKDLDLYKEAFADLDAAEDIIGGTNERLDGVRQEIQRHREVMQKEKLLKEKMRRAAGHAPITERLRASLQRPTQRPTQRPIRRPILGLLLSQLFNTVIGKLIILIGLVVGLPVVLWNYNLVAISVWTWVGFLSGLLASSLSMNRGRVMHVIFVGALGALIGGGAASLIVFYIANISVTEFGIWLTLGSTLIAFVVALVTQITFAIVRVHKIASVEDSDREYGE